MNTANLLILELTGGTIPMDDFLPPIKSGRASLKETETVTSEMSSPRNTISSRPNTISSTRPNTISDVEIDVSNVDQGVSVLYLPVIS